MKIEDEMKELILEKYKSVRAFTQELNIPYSTIDTMLKRGINGTGISTVLKICSALNIDVDSIERGKISFKKQSDASNQSSLHKKINKLDEIDAGKAESYIDGLLSNPKYEGNTEEQLA